MGGSVKQALFAMIMLRPLAKCDLTLRKRMWVEGTSFTNEGEGHPDDEEIAQEMAKPCGFYT